MARTVRTDNNVVCVGSRALHTLRSSLTRVLGEQAAERLQEAGYAGGEQIYASFCQWLPEYAGIDDPAELDASALGEVMSAFFEALGWGRLTVERAGGAALTITSTNWAEAEPGAEAQLPSCHIASGLFADFLGRLSKKSVAVMEVECRTRGEPRCKFVVGAPETLESVYNALAAGGDYQSALPT